MTFSFGNFTYFFPDSIYLLLASLLSSISRGKSFVHSDEICIYHNPFGKITVLNVSTSKYLSTDFYGIL